MDWNEPANWSDGLPSDQDRARIGDFTLASPITASLNSAAANMVIGELMIGQGALGDGTFNHSSGSLATTEFGWSFIGADGDSDTRGTYNLSGNASFTMDVGVRGVIDSFNEFEGTQLHIGIGNAGTVPALSQGTLNVSGRATVQANRMYVGSDDGNTGTVNQTSGAVYVDDWLSVGRTNEAAGTYNLSGGSLTIENDWLSIGERGGATGTLVVSGEALLDANSIGVGRFGSRTDTDPDTPGNQPDLRGSTGTLRILGSAASLTARGRLSVAIDDSNDGNFDGVSIKNDIQGTLEFVADEMGVSPISVLGDVWLNDGVAEPFCAAEYNGCGMAHLVVDLTAYSSTSDVMLIEAAPTSSVFGQFANAAEGAVVPGTGGRRITYVGGADGNDVMLVGLTEELLGDYNDDGLVAAGDLQLVLANWGDTAPPVPDGWLNQQPMGLIGASQLGVVLENWGKVATVPSVPEPTGPGLWALLALVGFARRR